LIAQISSLAAKSYLREFPDDLQTVNDLDS
jgi:hypothetical protein